MPNDIPAGATEERGPIPLVGGPYDGAMRTYTILFPFLGGGLPSGILVIGDHYYSLSNDRTRWNYGGVMAKGGSDGR